MNTTVTTAAENNNNTVYYYEPLTDEDRADHFLHDDDDPAIYVGTYYKYNNGSIDGAWLDLTTFNDYDELYDFMCRLHCDEEKPEFMILDFMNFPESLYGESGCNWDKLFALLNLDDDDRQKVYEYWDEIDGSADIDDILENCEYEGDANEYFDELAEEMFNLSGSDSPLAIYFNYEQWERDCSYDYSITTNYVFRNW